MVQITVDTDRDSVDTLKRLVHFLQEELRHRGVSPIHPQPIEPMRVESNNPFEISNSTLESSAPASGSFSDTSENSFSDMFGGNNNNSSESTPTTSEPTTASTPDMFSVFSHDAPEPTTNEVHSNQSAESFISSQMTSTPQETPSASQLLEEDDVHDVTEELAKQVWKTGSTRKPNNSLNLEPY